MIVPPGPSPGVRTLLILVCIIPNLIAAVASAQETAAHRFTQGQSVYIVSVKTSSRVEAVFGDRYDREVVRLFCGSTRNGAAMGGGWTRRSGPPTLERSDLDRGPLYSNDATLLESIQAEFRKRKKFTLATSMRSADFIFVAFSEYPSSYGVIDMGRREAIELWQGYDDSPYTTDAAAVFGFAVPRDAFWKVKKDPATLARVAQWQGYVREFHSGSGCAKAQDITAADLIQRFHDAVLKKKEPRTMQSTAMPTATSPAQGTPALRDPRSSIGSGPEADVPSSAETIRVETSLVEVPVSVTDRNGRAITDLARSDFEIYEDGVAQAIDRFSPVEVQLNIALLLDASSSMRIQNDELRRAAGAFVAALRPEDRVEVVSFNNEVYLNTESTSDRFLLGGAIYQTAIDRGTRLYDALDLILTDRLNRFAGRKAIVLFTDGVDTESRLADAGRVLDLAEESGAFVYVIRYDTATDVIEQHRTAIIGNKVQSMDTGRSNQALIGSEAYIHAAQFLEDLPERTGGRIFQTANGATLLEAFRHVGDELRRQYELSYYPANKVHDGSFRRIEVRVHRSGGVVRARPGYRAAKATN